MPAPPEQNNHDHLRSLWKELDRNEREIFVDLIGTTQKTWRNGYNRPLFERRMTVSRKRVREIHAAADSVRPGRLSLSDVEACFPVSRRTA